LLARDGEVPREEQFAALDPRASERREDLFHVRPPFFELRVQRLGDAVAVVAEAFARLDRFAGFVLEVAQRDYVAVPLEPVARRAYDQVAVFGVLGRVVDLREDRLALAGARVDYHDRLRWFGVLRHVRDRHGARLFERRLV